MVVDGTLKVGILYSSEDPEKYQLIPLSKKDAISREIPLMVGMAIMVDPRGRVAVIRRPETEDLYPGYYSTVAGHGESINGICETPDKTVLREVPEEANTHPLKLLKYGAGEKFVDASKQPIRRTFPYICLCTGGDLIFGPEIDPAYSGYVTVEELKVMLQKENFTPPSRMVFEKFTQAFSNTKELEDFYHTYL
jgi:8-oxo-dGTP pyrophosphatase MutT (NUDIX family)